MAAAEANFAGLRVARHELLGGERTRHGGERRADEPAADVGGEALAGAAQVDRVDARQVVAPEAELGDGEQAREHHAQRDVRDRQASRCRSHSSGISKYFVFSMLRKYQKNSGMNDQARHLEDAQAGRAG